MADILSDDEELLVMADILSDDEELPTCGICFNGYDEGGHTPLSLPCGHSICRICTDDILKLESSQCLCPQCRVPFTKANVSKNIELLHSVFVIKKLKKQASAGALQPISKSKPAPITSNESSDITLCSNCNEEGKCVICTDCADGKPRCVDCFEFAHKRKPTKHQTTPWDSANSPLMCRDHQQECVLFCHPCKKVVCVLCTHSPTHKGHNCTPVIDEVESTKREINVKCGELEEQTKPVQALGRQVDTVYRELTGVSIVENIGCDSNGAGVQEGTFDTTIRSIRTQFQKFQEDLKQRGDALIEEAHAHKQKKVAALENQMDGISLVVSKSYSVSSMTQYSLKTKGSQWILENKASMLESIQKNLLQTRTVLTPLAASSYLAFQVNQSGVLQFSNQIGCITVLSDMELAEIDLAKLKQEQERLAAEKFLCVLSPPGGAPSSYSDKILRGYKVISLVQFPEYLLAVSIPVASTAQGVFLYRAGVCIATGSAFQRFDAQWLRSIFPAMTKLCVGDAILCNAISNFIHTDTGVNNNRRVLGNINGSYIEIRSCHVSNGSDNTYNLHMQVEFTRTGAI